MRHKVKSGPVSKEQVNSSPEFCKTQRLTAIDFVANSKMPIKL
jgi:hypothetical protein